MENLTYWGHGLYEQRPGLSRNPNPPDQVYKPSKRERIEMEIQALMTPDFKDEADPNVLHVYNRSLANIRGIQKATVQKVRRMIMERMKVLDDSGDGDFSLDDESEHYYVQPERHHHHPRRPVHAFRGKNCMTQIPEYHGKETNDRVETKKLIDILRTRFQHVYTVGTPKQIRAVIENINKLGRKVSKSVFNELGREYPNLLFFNEIDRGEAKKFLLLLERALSFEGYSLETRTNRERDINHNGEIVGKIMLIRRPLKKKEDKKKIKRLPAQDKYARRLEFQPKQDSIVGGIGVFSNDKHAKPINGVLSSVKNFYKMSRNRNLLGIIAQKMIDGSIQIPDEQREKLKLLASKKLLGHMRKLTDRLFYAASEDKDLMQTFIDAIPILNRIAASQRAKKNNHTISERNRKRIASKICGQDFPVTRGIPRQPRRKHLEDPMPKQEL